MRENGLNRGLVGSVSVEYKVLSDYSLAKWSSTDDLNVNAFDA